MFQFSQLKAPQIAKKTKKIGPEKPIIPEKD